MFSFLSTLYYFLFLLNFLFIYVLIFHQSWGFEIRNYFFLSPTLVSSPLKPLHTWQLCQCASQRLNPSILSQQQHPSLPSANDLNYLIVIQTFLLSPTYISTSHTLIVLLQLYQRFHGLVAIVLTHWPHYYYSFYRFYTIYTLHDVGRLVVDQ